MSGFKQGVVAVAHPFLTSYVNLAGAGIGSHGEIAASPNVQAGDVREQERVQRVVYHNSHAADRVLSRWVRLRVHNFGKQRTQIRLYAAGQSFEGLLVLAGTQAGRPLIVAQVGFILAGIGMGLNTGPLMSVAVDAVSAYPAAGDGKA